MFITFLFSFVPLILTHTLWPRQVPSIQMDESWAAIFAHRIAFEPGFWPVYAMSPYTLAWSHYFNAIYFKIFGTNATVYRLCGVSQVIAGVAFISASLWTLGYRKAAFLLPVVIGFFPALVMNHRWAIDETNFFVLCAGLVAYGLALRAKKGPSRKAFSLIIVGTVLGVSCHVLFLAASLALWVCLYLTGKIQKSSDRHTVVAIAILLIPFFYLISLAKFEDFGDKGVEAQSKGLVLIAIALVIVLFSFVPITQLKSKMRNVLLGIGALPGCILFVPFIIFIEGTWLSLFSTGLLETKIFVASILIPIFLTLYFLGQSKRKIPSLEKYLGLYCFLPINILLIYAMVTKAGPRYFEIPFLFVAAGIAILFSQLKKNQLILVLLIWVVAGAGQLTVNYFKPSIEEKQLNITYRLWRWRDSSGGYMPKMRLARRLASEGCTYSDISHLDLDLQFLSIGDWPTLGRTSCRLGKGLIIEVVENGNAVNQPELGRYAEGQFLIVSHIKGL